MPPFWHGFEAHWSPSVGESVGVSVMQRRALGEGHKQLPTYSPVYTIQNCFWGGGEVAVSVPWRELWVGLLSWASVRDLGSHISSGDEEALSEVDVFYALSRDI